MEKGCYARFHRRAHIVSNVLKRKIIKERKLQKILLWIGVVIIVLTMSFIITIPLVWFTCFLLLFYSRTMSAPVNFSAVLFYMIWIKLAVLEGASVLTRSFKFCLFPDDDIEGNFRWNWIKRWSWTPVLVDWLEDFGFKEATIGPSDIILDFAFGVDKRPAWADIKTYVDSGNILNTLRTSVFEDRYPWSWVICSSRWKIRHRRRIGVCEVLPYLVSSLISVVIIQIKFWIFTPGPWMLHEVCWLPFNASYIIGIYLVVVAPIQMLRRPQPKTPKAACFCSGCGLVMCLITRLISRVCGLYLLGQRLRFSHWNNLVWLVYFSSHDAQSQKDCFDWLRENLPMSFL